MKVTGKVIVVTGGGSGMGRELVLQLLTRGASVAAIDVNAEALQETAALAQANAARLATFILNITDRARVEALPADVIARFNAVDGVINCAGIIQPFVRFKDLEWSAIDRVLAVNLQGTLAMTKAFLPHLLARPEGHIVNISSMGGFLPVPGQTIYGASKAAVKLMTEGLHSELADTKVRVTVVFPGAIATNIASNSGVSMGISADDAKKASSIKMTPADRAARIILDGMESDAFRVLVGPDAKLMDALVRLNPRRATAFIARQMRELLRS
jgi:short-subunit dehydrogenase